MSNEHSAEFRDDGILVVRIHGDISDEEFHRFCDDLERLYEPVNEAFAAVVDVSMLEFLSATRRKRFAEMDLKYREKDRAFNRGQAFVVRNSLVRGALTAIHWLARPVYRVNVVETFDEGLAWAQRQLAAGSTEG